MNRGRLHLALLVTLIGTAARAATPAELSLERAHSGTISSGEIIEHGVFLQARPTLITVNQEYVDTGITIRSETGIKLLGVNAPYINIGRELAMFEPPEAGRYIVEISGITSDSPTGNYSLTVSQRRFDDRFLAATSASTIAASLDADSVGAQRQTVLKEAAAHFGESAVLWKTAGETQLAARSLLYEGRLLHELSEFGPATQRYEQAMQLAERDTTLAVWILANLGRGQLRLNDLDAAESSFRDAHTRATAIGDEFANALMLNYIGLVYQYRNMPASALLSYEQSLALLGPLNQPHHEAVTLSNVGGANYQMGKFEAALEHYRRALALHNDSGDAEEQATVLGNMASLYREQGDLGRSLDLNLRTLEIYRLLENEWGMNLVNQRLGMLYRRIGDFARAENYYERAIAGRIKTGSLGSAASSKISLGDMYFDRKQYARASRLHREGLALREQTGNTNAIARARVSLARDYLVSGQLDEARELLESSYAVLVDAGLPRQIGFALSQMGKLDAMTGQTQGAIDSYSQALKIFQDAQDPLSEIDTLIELAGLQPGHEQALTYLLQAETVSVRVRQSLNNPLHRARFIDSRNRLYNEIVDRYLWLARENVDSDYSEKAYLASSQSRSQALMEIILADTASSDERTEDELQRRRATQRKLNAAWFGVEALRRSTLNEETSRLIAQKESEITDLVTELDALDVRIVGPKLTELNRSPPGLQRIQDSIQKDELVLHYHVSDNDSVVWAVSKEGFERHDLGDATSLVAAAKDVHRMLGKPGYGKAEKQALQEISARLLAGTLDAPGIRKVYVIADDVLHYIPFSALLRSDGKHVVEYAVTKSIPSAALLTLAARPERLLSDSTRITVYADPVFDGSDFRVQEANRRDRNSPPGESDGQEIVSRAGGQNLARLAHSRTEAEGIRAAAPQTDVYYGFSASKDDILGRDLKDVDILHFATHGITNDSVPELSGLFLSRLDGMGQEIDGFLSLGEIESLQIDPQLVVLSACNTAIGENIFAEGPLSLSRAFLGQGADDVVSTLWQVADEQSAELIQHFYSGLLDGGLSVPAALRRAQIRILADTRFAAPYYWAAYTTHSTRPERLSD